MSYITYNLLIDNTERSFRITKILDDDLRQLAYELINNEQDIMIIFDGEEGSGKSHTMRQIGYVLNQHLKKFNVFNEFSSKNIHYKVLDYIKESYAHKENVGYINVLDEGGDEIDRNASISKESKRFVRYLRKCRKLQQIHLIAMPSAHDLQKYVALWRQKFIIKMSKKRVSDEKSPTGRSLSLGEFRIIRNDNRWKYCYMDKVPYKYPTFLHSNKKLAYGGKKTETVQYYADHAGKFDYCEVFPKQELDALREKNLVLAEEFDTAQGEGKRAETKKDLIKKYLAKHPEASRKEIADIFSTSINYVKEIKAET